MLAVSVRHDGLSGRIRPNTFGRLSRVNAERAGCDHDDREDGGGAFHKFSLAVISDWTVTVSNEQNRAYTSFSESAAGRRGSFTVGRSLGWTARYVVIRARARGHPTGTNSEPVENQVISARARGLHSETSSAASGWRAILV